AASLSVYTWARAFRNRFARDPSPSSSLTSSGSARHPVSPLGLSGVHTGAAVSAESAASARDRKERMSLRSVLARVLSDDSVVAAELTAVESLPRLLVIVLDGSVMRGIDCRTPSASGVL